MLTFSRMALCMSVLIACSHPPRTSNTDRNIIKADEMATVEAVTAYDVVAKLRSEFLKSHGTVTRAGSKLTGQETPAVSVFVDGVESGPAESSLRLIPAAELFQIRFYRAGDAATKFGTRHNGGVIEVTTNRSSRP